MPPRRGIEASTSDVNEPTIQVSGNIHGLKASQVRQHGKQLNVRVGHRHRLGRGPDHAGASEGERTAGGDRHFLRHTGITPGHQPKYHVQRPQV
jgi:hypothetical protein